MLPEYAPRRGIERVWIVELAGYLDHSPVAICAWCRKRRALRRWRSRHGGIRHWITPEMAMRVILWARSVQGEQYLKHRDYHVDKERTRLYQVKCRQRKKALLKQSV